MHGDLPQIKAEDLVQRLSQRVAELVSQVASLELLAEALRDERNQLRARVSELKGTTA